MFQYYFVYSVTLFLSKILCLPKKNPGSPNRPLHHATLSLYYTEGSPQRDECVTIVCANAYVSIFFYFDNCVVRPSLGVTMGVVLMC